MPFKGTPEVDRRAVSGDSVHCYWAPISAGMSAIKGGKLRALAVSTAKRNPHAARRADDRRGRREERRFAALVRHLGAGGHAGGHRAEDLADVRKALADPGVKEKLVALGNDTMDMSPGEFAKFVREEIDTYQDAGIKPQ